jgi:hypothetical protein
MVHGHLDYLQNPLLEGRLNTKPGDYGTPNVLNRRFVLFYHGVRTNTNRNSLKWHLVEGPVTYDFTLHLKARDHTT